MSVINYEDLELRALAHMAYQCGPRMKSVFVDCEAVRELSRRHHLTEGVFDCAALELAVARSFGLRHAEVAADLQRLANAQPWDPAPPLRMGPQRCLSPRETIERLAFVLPKPARALTPKEVFAAIDSIARTVRTHGPQVGARTPTGHLRASEG